MNTRSILFGCTVLFGGMLTGPLPTLAVPPATASPADTPAVVLVRQYVADRAAGKTEAAYALLSSLSQVGMPLDQEPETLREVRVGVLNPVAPVPMGHLPMAALFADFHDALHFEFHVLKASKDDPNVVLVSAYQAGTPLSSKETLRIATLADPVAGGSLRIDGVRSSPLFFPDGSFFAQRAASQLNLKRISLGVILYTQDHDERLPDAASWMDEIMPYVKTEAVFHDPSAPAGEKWSYAYNRTLSHVPLGKLEYPAHTVMLFESSLGVKNAADAGQSVPMPGRHGGTHYVTADGHAQLFPDGTKLSYRLDGK